MINDHGKYVLSFRETRIIQKRERARYESRKDETDAYICLNCNKKRCKGTKHCLDKMKEVKHD